MLQTETEGMFAGNIDDHNSRVIDDHNSLSFNALGTTTVLQTLMEIDGLSDNGNKPLCRNTTHETYKVK